MSLDLQECLSFISEVAKDAGKIIVKGREKLSSAQHIEANIQSKENYADLVTKYDVEVETFLRSQIHEKYPNHKFIGEESAQISQQLTTDPTWIIDPIDGTTNFVHGFEFVAISIGLVIEKKSNLGLIYAPLLNKMVTSISGQGSYCNGKAIHVSNCKDLSKALVIAEFGSDRNAESLNIKLGNLRSVIECTHGIRALGSCALNMVEVAMGNVDASFELGPHCWDMAAGELIIREAGGVILHPAGKDFDLMSRCYIGASTKELAESLRLKLKLIEYPRDCEVN